MKPAASLANAFKTIQDELGFDMFSNLPHPENIRFQQSEERKAMYRLGNALAHIVGSAQSEDLHYAAHVIRRYFGDALGMEPMPQFMEDVPRFLLQPDSPATHRTDPQQLAHHLEQIPMPAEDVICIVSAKLQLLQKLLRLSDVEVKFLKLAYAVSSQHQRTHSLSVRITTALEHIAVHDEAHRNRAIALLLNQPLEDVAQMLAAPCRLKALRFVDPIHSNSGPRLRDYFVLTDEFVGVLESSYRSHKALLQAILEPECDLNILYDEDVPIGHLYETWPKELAQAFECAVLERPMKSHHIDTLVRWYTGGYRAHPAQYGPLAGRLTVEGVREAIKQAAFDCCMAHMPLDGFALMQALYAAATISPRPITNNTTEMY